VFNETVETTDQMETRLSQLVSEIDKLYENKDIVMVFHADPIQVMKTVFLKLSPFLHRADGRVLPTVKPAELVVLELAKLESPQP
jgi:broad specificity phosphatase PhoE